MFGINNSVIANLNEKIKNIDESYNKQKRILDESINVIENVRKTHLNTHEQIEDLHDKVFSIAFKSGLAILLNHSIANIEKEIEEMKNSQQ